MANDLIWGQLVNHVVEDMSTLALARQNIAFDLKQFLTGVIGPGGSGVWTVRRSSNSVSEADSDLWLTPANVVLAAVDGNSHSWVILRNTTLGLECLLDVVGVNQYPLGIYFAPITSPFSPGSITNRPTSGHEFGGPSLNSRWLFGSAAPAKLHGLLSERGDFWFFVSMDGAGQPYFGLGVCKLKNAKAGDAFPWVAYCSGSGSAVLARGPITPHAFSFDNYDVTRTPAFWGRAANGAAIGGTGPLDYIGAASLMLCYRTSDGQAGYPLDGSELDLGDGGSLTMPFLIGISKDSYRTFKGEWPDALIGKHGLAGNIPYPNALTQEKLKIGTVWLPFTSQLSL